jgi:hypothetical protein
VELSDEHWELIAAVRAQWRDAALTTGPVDRDEVQAGVVEAYQAAGLAPPRLVLWFDSPVAGTWAANRLAALPSVEDRSGEVRLAIDRVRWGFRDRAKRALSQVTQERVWREVLWQLRYEVGSLNELVADEVHDRVWSTPQNIVEHELWTQLSEQSSLDLAGEAIRPQIFMTVREAFGGHFDAHEVAPDDALAQLGLDGGVPPTGLFRVTRSGGWWWPMREAVVLCERPVELHRDEYGRASRVDGAAIVYPDGFAVHAWHGDRVPARVSAGDVTGVYWLAESSARVRAAITARLGYRRLLAEVPAIDWHRTEDATLWLIREPGSDDYGISQSFVAPEDIWLVELADGTLRRVPPAVQTAPDALAWAAGHPDDHRPPRPSY